MSKFSACKSKSKLNVTRPAKSEHVSAKVPPIFSYLLYHNTLRIEAQASISYK